LRFEKEYFEDFEYSLRNRLIKRHVLEVLRWGSKVSNSNLLNGQRKTALDVGCAYGYAVAILKSLGYDAYGVDISKYSVKKAKKTLGTADFTICDVQWGLPFKNKIFDLVTCFEVLEHLENPLQAIRNIFGACKDIMIYTTPNRTVEKPIKKIIRDFDNTHINVGTPREWQKYLTKNLRSSVVRVESFYDANLRVANRVLFYKSLKMPYFGLNIRILIKKGQNQLFPVL